jgi:hypothetical protein
MESQPDIDPQETQEWLDALDSVILNVRRGTCAFSPGKTDRESSSLWRLFTL